VAPPEATAITDLEMKTSALNSTKEGQTRASARTLAIIIRILNAAMIETEITKVWEPSPNSMIWEEHKTTHKEVILTLALLLKLPNSQADRVASSLSAIVYRARFKRILERPCMLAAFMSEMYSLT
jgi:hypothetical protein